MTLSEAREKVIAHLSAHHGIACDRLIFERAISDGQTVQETFRDRDRQLIIHIFFVVDSGKADPMLFIVEPLLAL